jgi:hypothetical protein
MWLPASLIPAALARDPWTRHLVARLAASLAAGASLAAVPWVIPAVAEWLDARCVVQAVAGLPCPGCGVTRSLLALGAGDLRTAVHANLGGLAVAGALAGQSVVAAGVLVRHGAPGAGSRWLAGFDRAAIGALLVVWIARLAGLGR